MASSGAGHTIITRGGGRAIRRRRQRYPAHSTLAPLVVASLIIYIGPRNPLRFACPLCSFWSDDPEVPSRPTWLTWRAVGFEEVQEPGDYICKRCGSSVMEKNGKYGKFWGCTTWAKTKCKGGRKPGPRPTVTITRTKVELALWVESGPWMPAADRKAWEDAEARRAAYRRRF